MPLNKGTIAVIWRSPFIRAHFRMPSYSGNMAQQGSDPGLLGYSYRSKCQCALGAETPAVQQELNTMRELQLEFALSTGNNSPWPPGVGRYWFKDENSLAVTGASILTLPPKEFSSLSFAKSWCTFSNTSVLVAAPATSVSLFHPSFLQ